MEKYGMKMENEFKKAEMVVSSFGSMIANGFNSFYDNKPKFMAFASGLCILTAGLVFSRRGMALGLKRLESYLFTPKLIKEFKRKNLFFNLGQSHKLLTPAMKFENEGLIYNSKTEKLLHDIIQSTKTSLSNQGVFRNFLLYGPPGTGKTLFAKKLALYSGLSYAILTGGDVVPLREKAVTEIHKVFDWSARNRGLILFLDEADAFLKKRDQVNMGEEMRSALNSFLYRTGGISNNLMLILATNKPEHLDRAVTDRIDMMIEFPLPDAPTRERLFHYYFTLRVESKANQQDFNLNDVIDELVTSSDGFSAREIAKMCLSWETSALSNNSRKITKPLIIDEVKNMRKQNETKRTWDKLEHR
ncbi:hypothetical protein HZS_6323 [Henneguya salminicola]|nr:hypothetical protein HZS_6323 [Henneguya salminicola]